MCYCTPERRTPVCQQCPPTMHKEIQRLSELLWGCRCIFCGEVVGKEAKAHDVADEVLKAHIKVCPDHPVNGLRRALETAIAIVKATGPQPPLDTHRCGPESNCDTSCQEWAAFCKVIEGLEAPLKGV